ncbi:MAG: YhgE/Pip domain-containing protein [Ruminococcus sp.]|nr:YhgE/Pip domain-containing protein [Ruminococcus sp.]
MKNIWRIFRNDVKSVTKNLIVFVVIIGISILPALYAWFNIASNWDPYSNTGNLPFAVCNNDKGIEYKTVKIVAGEKIVDNLKQNDKMGWVFIDSADDAREGVKNGEYYAAVVIPEDFSKNLLSVTSGKFEQAKLEYYVNEKKNAIAPKITDKGISALEESIDSAYVDTLAKTIATTLNVTGDEIQDKKEDFAKKLTSSIQSAQNDVKTFMSTNKVLLSVLDTLDGLVKSGKDTIPAIKTSLGKAGVATTQDVKTALKATNAMNAQITSTIEELIDSGTTYSDNIIQQIKEAAEEIKSDNAEKKEEALRKIANIKVMCEKSITVNNRVISIMQSVQTELGIDTSKVVSKIQAATEKHNETIKKIDAITKAKAMAEDARAELEKIATDGKAAVASVKSEFAGVKAKIDETVKKAYSSLDSISDFMQAMSTDTSSLDSAFKSASDSIASLKSVLTTLNTSLESVSGKMDSLLKKVKELNESDTIESIIMPIIERPEDLGKFISAPVTYNSNRIYALDNYGSAMTPFYSSLGFWVGGTVLIAVVSAELTKKEKEKLGNPSATQQYFGRYIMIFLLGQLQAIIISLGDLYFLKIQCENPLLSGMLHKEVSLNQDK